MIGMDGSERARLARRLWELDLDDWHGFIQTWLAFNAVYNLVSGSSERDRLMNAVRTLIPPSEAARILAKVEPAWGFFSQLPPGDMRKDPGHPRFRERSAHDLAIVSAAEVEPIERLAHLLSVVYQIRCNLLHGSKDPDNIRDQGLVTASKEVLDPVLEVMLPKLDAAAPGGSSSH